MTLFAPKSTPTSRAEGDAAGERALRRSLNAVQLTTLGIGAVIGAGIFVFTGVAAARYAGPAVPLSFVAAGIACTLAAPWYAEMASAVPVAGSAYTYSYATMGEFIAWIIGWDLVLEYAMGASTVGAGWSSYFVALLKNFGVTLPASVTSAPYLWCDASDVGTKAGCLVQGFNVTGGVVNVPAIFIVALMSLVLVVGIRESARVNNYIVALKLAVIALVIVARPPALHKAKPPPPA